MFDSEAALSENPISWFLKTENGINGCFFYLILLNEVGHEIELKYFVKNV
jgi:hypothetical protein